MISKKLLLASAAIVVVGSAAIVAPTIASGVPQGPSFSTVDDRGPGDKHADGPGNNGRGHAYGHDKDAESFPGNKGGNGGGKAWGHHKDSPGFPGNNGRGDD